MSKKVFVSVGDDLVETDICIEGFENADLILIKVGNDTYPALDRYQLRAAQDAIVPLLKSAGVTAPILVWNHAIDITKIRIRDIPLEKL